MIEVWDVGQHAVFYYQMLCLPLVGDHVDGHFFTHLNLIDHIQAKFWQPFVPIRRFFL